MTDYKIIQTINGPEDVKKLSMEQLEELASEIREALFNRLTKIGGHFGPNFGMVEAEIAMHYVFSSPKDKFIFDVSHQSYPHKILTGRKNGYISDEHFSEDSGYTNPEESEHDFFNVGHTSTSVSLATGLAKARDIKGDKENIIANYLDSNDTNLNYIRLIQNAKNGNDFKISDKTRLKAKRLHKSETEKILSKNSMKYGVSISFPENATKIKNGFVDENLVAHYSYSLDYIRENSDFYTLFKNFKVLFEYVDIQNRINLVSKRSQMGVFESVMGVRSQNEYRIGAAFSLTDMTSQNQIYGYGQILNTLNISLESILNFVFTSFFQEKYDFPNNASFLIPSVTNSHFEKVRILAPEFESVLKQFKLFVEDGNIDFELLQISSSPSAIK